MTHEPALLTLGRLVRTWRLRVTLAYSMQAFGWSLLLAAVLSTAFGWSVAKSVAVGLAGGIVILGATLAVRRKRLGDARLLARHLDRRIPALEESCELALEPSEPAALLTRLQRRRVIRALEALPSDFELPTRDLRIAGGVLALTCVAATALWVLGRSGPSDGREPASRAPSHASQPEQPSRPKPQIVSLSVVVEPPAYTARQRQQVTALDVQAPEGSRVAWTVGLSREVGELALELGQGERKPLERTEGQTYRGEMIAESSRIYFLETVDDGKVSFQSDYGRLQVIRDVPPAVRMTRPERRTELEPTALAPLAVSALAQDDYGISRAELVMTLTRGSGESIQFREHKQTLDVSKKDPSGMVQLETTLDLAGLGMGPGDELYFYIEAQDNRQPEPNRGRSETSFVKVRRLEEPPPAGLEGIVIQPVPEYFRSQRQIIIDTEKLIADKPNIAEAEFKRRSEALGFDQRLLRMRYGGLLGEEVENDASPGGDSHDDEPGGGDEHDSHLGPPADSGFAGSRQLSSPLNWIPSDMIHQHDSAESATYFPNEVRATLKAALAQMWDAELYLRTDRPEEALPHEYEALRHLKELQEATRMYVERVGFEPPPLRPDEKRLTGDLSAIDLPTTERDLHRDRAFPVIREALLVLEALERTPESLPANAAETLQSAGQELARQALGNGDISVKALDDLRSLITGMSEHSEPCHSCIDTLRKALLGLLPPAQAGPARSALSPSRLFDAYVDELEKAP